MRFRGWVLCVVFCIACSIAGVGPAVALSGAAAGHVGLIDTYSKAFGYSSYSGRWTSVALSGPAQSKKAGDFLGYVRTAQKLYSFNSTNDHWYSIDYAGQFRGEDARGATSVVWTATGIYAIASLWTIWRVEPFQPDEAPVGGGSAGSFGLVWTNKRGYAFHSATGTWMVQPISGRTVSGIAKDDFGLLWSTNQAFSFDPTPGGWVPLDLDGMLGISAAGGGSVGLVWGGTRADAYSGALDMWVPFQGSSGILGGAATGEVAILWDASMAHCFNANTGVWSSVALQIGFTKLAESEEVGGFSVGPNPCTGVLNFRLPTTDAWKLEIFDVEGGLVWQRQVDAGDAGGGIAWDGRSSGDRRVAAGTYWIRAESSRGQVEARRVVLIP